jgi:4-amino-4-deoxy-L-arabinose transferase-like glycosyltransferase
MRRPVARTAVILCGFVVVAVIVRLAWTLWTAPTTPHLTDPQYYHAAAVSLARGDGYSIEFVGDDGFLPGTEATALWPPGYSTYLAPWHWAFGDALAVARLANVMAGSLVVIPVFFIGKRLFDERAGWVAAGIAAVLPSLVFWTPVLMPETLFTLVFGSAFALLLQSAGSDGSVRMPVVAMLGVVLGLGTLLRGQMFVLLPVTAVWWLLLDVRIRRAAAAAGVIVLIFAAFLGAWTLRNAVMMDEPIVLATDSGYALRIGHADYSVGRYVVANDLWTDSRGTAFPERELFFNDEGTRRAIEYASSHPARELALAGRKVMWLWRPDTDALDWSMSFGETPLTDGAEMPLRWLLAGTYFVLLGSAAVGFATTRRSTSILIVTLIAGWTAMHVVFFGEPRYHVPILAVLVPAAAAGMLRLAGRATANSRIRVFAS